MEFNVFIEPEALNDIQEAVYWYNEKQKGLGKRFFSEVKKKIVFLRKNPFYAIRYDNIRCVLVEKFPYLIHYYINENEKLIVIISIFHSSRNPNLWNEHNILE
jgi:plasmid stabilization system protein ParE